MISATRTNPQGFNQLLLKEKNEFAILPFNFIALSKALLSGVVLIFIQSCSFQWQTQNTFTLKANSEYHERLSISDPHFYQIQLKKNEYLRVLIDSPEIDIRLDIYDAQGQVLQALNLYHGGYFPLSLLAAQEGTYRFNLSAREKEVVGDYTIRVIEYRNSNATDKIRVAADAVFMKGELSRYDLKKDSLQAATVAFRQVITEWRKIGESGDTAKALTRIGEIAQIEGNGAEAKDLYSQALLLVGSDLRLKIDLYNNLFSLDTSDKPLQKECAASLELSRQLNYKKGEAQAIGNLAKLAKNNNNQSEALEKYQQSLEILRRLNDRRGQAQVFYMLGTIYAKQAQGEQFYIQSFMLSQAVNDKRGQARALTEVGHWLSRSGSMQEASNHYQQAYNLAKDAGDETQMFRIANGWGFLYESYGEYEKALQQYRNALSISQATRNGKNIVIAWVQIGGALRLLGNYQAARATLLYAARISHNFPKYKAYALMYLGAIYHTQQQDAAALRYFQRARDLLEANNDKGGIAEVSNEIGNFYADRSQYSLARQYYLSALGLFQKINEPFNVCQTHFLLAKLAYNTRNMSEALREIQTAVKLSEDLRENTLSQTLRTSYLAAVNNSYQLYIEILMREVPTYPLNNFVAEALHISEQSRARSFLDILNEAQADIEKDLNPKLKEKKRDLFQLLSAKRDRRSALLSGEHKQEEIDVLNKEISELELQSDNLQMQIRNANPRYAALTNPQPLNAAQIQELLDDDTVLLEYALGEQHSYLWAVTRDRIEAFTLPKRSVIERDVHQLYELMKVRDDKPGETPVQRVKRIQNADKQFPSLAAKISKTLLQPVAHKLGNKRLVIVGDGALHYLPFAALPDCGLRIADCGLANALLPAQKRSTSKKIKDSAQPTNPQSAIRNPQSYKPLVVNHEIVMLPSASALQMIRENRNGAARPLDSVAVLADPVFNADDERITAAQNATLARATPNQTRTLDLSDANGRLPQLPMTRDEAVAIAKLLPTQKYLLKEGFAVNRQAFATNEFAPFSILHLATHGVVNTAAPDASGIVLSRFDAQGRAQENAILRLGDLYGMKLQQELIVLSACETAWGKEVKGEGLMALSRGFFYAGAPRVMASLWKVEELATAELMQEFYKQLLQEKKSPAAALRAAQIAQWQQNPAKAPYDWAAFVLQGEYK